MKTKQQKIDEINAEYNKIVDLAIAECNKVIDPAWDKKNKALADLEICEHCGK